MRHCGISRDAFAYSKNNLFINCRETPFYVMGVDKVFN